MIEDCFAVQASKECEATPVGTHKCRSFGVAGYASGQCKVRQQRNIVKLSAQDGTFGCDQHTDFVVDKGLDKLVSSRLVV